jgi:hypothetical protein
MMIAAFFRRFGPATAISIVALSLSACKDGTEPLVPSAVQPVAGQQQVAAVGSAVPVAPSVKVVTSSGKPVPGVRVTFAPAAESGTVVGGTQTTDASGVATVTSWTLGTRAGASTLTATADGVAPITFTATTTAGTPASVAAVPTAALSGLVGTALTIQPTVTVKDAYGNVTPGVDVDFLLINGGVIERTRAQTDANGVAGPGRWTLTTVAGAQALRATVNVPALLQSPVFITATALPDVASQMVIARQPSTTSGSGAPLTVQPIVEFRDRFNNVATSSTLGVTASLVASPVTLSGTTTVNAQAGRATFTNLVVTGTGQVTFRFAATGFQEATSVAFAVAADAACPGTAVSLDYALGQSARFITNDPALPRCLTFNATRNAGQQYLVMLENLSTLGNFGSGVFPGLQSDDGILGIEVQTRSTSGAITSAPMARSSLRQQALPANAVTSWDFGGEPIYEVEPKTQPIGSKAAMVLRDGALVSANSIHAAVAVGDTLVIQLEGVPRLNIPTGMQRAIVKLVTPDIIISEDIRIVNQDPAFTRGNGTRNTPMTAADVQAIANHYSQYALVQANRLFANGYNSATTSDPGRPIAVHTLMMADNIWGYTYSTVNYFAWDYWVSTADGATKGNAQLPQRVSDNLFMHEIAHMRHWGLLERTGRTSIRGNRWVVEGFARSTERLPIAMRLLNDVNFSRINNLTLPFDPDIRNSAGAQAYYIDDVPNYLATSSSMYEGYASSAFVFDYFADQVAKAGGDWVVALREFLISAGSKADIDAVVNKYLPGLDFGTVFTRARLALYLDDFDPALPAWTQYHQYNLRVSRPPSSNAPFDPRNSFPRIAPGSPFSDNRTVGAGGSFGYLIDGTGTPANTRIDFTPSIGANGIMTVVRIK